MTDFRSSAQYQTTLAQLAEKLQSDLSLPAIVGISGAQGSGKSTLAAELVVRLKRQSIKAAAVSLDDYYLSKAQRQQLAQTEHPLLALRGVPGTHNIASAIKDAKAVLAGRPVALPQFDKALDEPTAPLTTQRLDMLIVEGWCLGVAAQPGVELAVPVNRLEQHEDKDGRWRRYVNSQLAGPYAEYWQLLNPLIWLNAPDWDCVCRWRAKQEQQLWQNRGSGMSDNELARFMLPFQRLTQASWQQLPQQANMIITLDQQHSPTTLTIT
ncbi:MAG TPA: kinase [Rheinheimera sp.]|nr:kinase [Rheinheimera sp.]